MKKIMIMAMNLIMTITLILDVFVFPMTTAFASNGKDDKKAINWRKIRR